MPKDIPPNVETNTDEKKLIYALVSGAISFEDAKKLIKEKGGGYPGIILDNIGHITDLDVNQLATSIIVNGSSHAVIKKWNTLPGLDKEKMIDVLKENRSLPYYKESLELIAGVGHVGDLLNKLAEKGETGAYFKTAILAAEEGTVTEAVATKLLEKGYIETINLNIKKFTPEAQVLITGYKKKV